MTKTPAVLRSVMHRLREAALYARMPFAPKGRKILVLQSTGRTMSGLLRGYEIADQLCDRGWNCLVLPKQLELAQRKRVLRRFDPDLVLLLKSRDPRNSHALLKDYPYLYDVDDADFLDPEITERMTADVAGAEGVTAGSRYVADWCRQHNPNTRVVWTGTRPSVTNWTDHSSREPIISWAQSDPTRYPREFDFVVEVIEQLAAQRDGVRLRLYGGDGTGDGGRTERLRAKGVTVDWMPFMSYEDFIASLDDIAVGLSPICVQSDFSRGKSFGKILAYLDARVPVVASDEGDHEVFFTPGTGVISNAPEVWVQAISGLLDSPEARNDMVRAAHTRFLEKLSLSVATDQVEALIRETLERIDAGG
jgi:glycosyltransferase involved in cell wall biosynthesis